MFSTNRDSIHLLIMFRTGQRCSLETRHLLTQCGQSVPKILQVRIVKLQMISLLSILTRYLYLHILPRSELNKYPTVENLLDVVKDLNGVGETGNSLLSEHWSSKVATSLFEHEQSHTIAAMPEFDVSNYPTPNRLSSSFKAVASYMKSRTYRKVNREVFVVGQGGYDMHSSDSLDEKFQEANSALDGFIQEVKNQGLWESTVIVMGSDFGRRLVLT